LDWFKGTFTGKPHIFNGKNPWVSGSDFPNKTNPMTFVILQTKNDGISHALMTGG